MTDEKVSVKNAKRIIKKISNMDYNNKSKLMTDMNSIKKSVENNHGIFTDDLYFEMIRACDNIISLLERSRLDEAKKNINYFIGLLKQELE